jgi:nucleotide-binding universal stress UspA family protein
MRMTPKNILVPLDFSPCSEQALDYACALGAKLGATVHIMNSLGAGLPELNVALTESMIDNLIRGHQTALQKVADPRRPLVNIGKVVVKSGDARDSILESAREVDADLIVMGTHGRRGLTRFVVGSVTEDVLRRAPCPVLAVRPKQKGDPS